MEYKDVKVVIFGYTELGKRLYEKFFQEGYAENEIMFCDNSTKKQESNAGKVFSVKWACEHSTNSTKFYLASLYHFKQMQEQLLKYGIPYENIVIDLPAEIMREAIELQKNDKLLPRKNVQLDIAIVRHCNLCCKGCDHFSPLAQEQYMPIENYERDLRRLSELLNGDIAYINLLGGEPLLNPDIIKFMSIGRSCFASTDINVCTNGLLLRSMSNDFWQACRDYNISIMATEYPINLDYKKLKEFVLSQGVEFKYTGSSEGGRSLWHFPLDLQGKQNPMESFVNCRNANTCHTLENGRIYTCSIAPYIDDFNKYYGTDLKLLDMDGIDIHQEGMTGEYILKRLAAPMPFCRYCDVKHRTYDHPWELSKKDMKEWTL